MADRPDAIRLVVVDYDVEGADEAEITHLPQQEEGCVEAALVSEPLVETAEESRLALLFAAVEG